MNLDSLKDQEMGHRVAYSSPKTTGEPVLPPSRHGTQESSCFAYQSWLARKGPFAKEGPHSRPSQVVDDDRIDHDPDDSYSNCYPDDRNDESQDRGDERPDPCPAATIPQPISQNEGDYAEDEASKREN